ncbi:DUF1840 domain-containing protein [Lacimicrobium sp. SS2-24]|uniref:DUF1840 domain-containing protein n=1 Tax=Lacimicrobium sp. SS2-24 TaxID=2005569 RepID=UPI000B4B749B|nr:DUF1840 domain-containing protein [Lacimicrobium sp. SS2-24]
MIVTFKTKAYSNITLFGDVAVQLLKMMGQTGKVPGAIKDEDVILAHDRLKRALATLPENEETDNPSDDSDAEDQDDEEQESPVSLRNRAKPLLALLASAAKDNVHVSWEAGG